jgi:hypothetical protein
MRRRQRLQFLLMAILLFLVAADTLYWYIVERNLADGFAAWRTNQQALGWQIDSGEPIRGGWPINATLTIPAMTVRGGDRDFPGGLNWSTEHLELNVPLWHPTVLTASAPGAQRLRFANIPEIAYTTERMTLSLPLTEQTAVQQMAFDVTNLRESDASLGSLHADLAFNPTAPSNVAMLDIAAEARGVKPTGEFSRSLGPEISHVIIDAVLNGPLPVGADGQAKALAWRNAGGSVVIRNFALVWGPLDFSANANLTLDDQLQPTGDGYARAIGYAETLDACAAKGLITRSTATATKAVLSLLANYPADGGAPSVSVPLTLRDETLSMRQVPLIRVPAIKWP